MHIREQIQRIAGTFGIDLVQKLTCTVNSVSISDRSCMVTPQNSSLGQIKAYLMAETDDGILIIPSLNSTVKVLCSRLNAATVIQYSAIDSILWLTGTNEGNGIQLEGSSYGGLIINEYLQDNLNAISKYIISTLQPAIANAFTAVGAGSAANGPAGASSFNTAMSGQSITFEDMENTLVQHGDGS
jgi:hypothetical protein